MLPIPEQRRKLHGHATASGMVKSDILDPRFSPSLRGRRTLGVDFSWLWPSSFMPGLGTAVSIRLPPWPRTPWPTLWISWSECYLANRVPEIEEIHPKSETDTGFRFNLGRRESGKAAIPLDEDG